MDDIKRLKNELKWRPGKCALCNGIGKVEPAIINTVAANDAYLTLDISKEERTRFINRDPGAVKRGELQEQQFDLFVQQIKDMYFVEHRSVEEIAAIFLQSSPKYDLKKKKELASYIQKVVDSVKE